MQARGYVAVVLLVGAALAAGCGDGAGDGYRFHQVGVLEDLPTLAGADIASICASAEGSGNGPDDARRRQRQGERGIAGLVRGFHVGAGSPVEVKYYVDNDSDSGGEGAFETERITVRELAGRQLELLRAVGTGTDRACSRRAIGRVKHGLMLKGAALQQWLAQEDVRNYVKAFANGDERAACQRFALRLGSADLNRLSGAFGVAKRRADEPAADQCLRQSQAIAEKIKPAERRRLGAIRLGTPRVSGRRGCVPIGRDGFTVARSSGRWVVTGLRPLKRYAPRQAASQRVRYRGC